MFEHGTRSDYECLYQCLYAAALIWALACCFNKMSVLRMYTTMIPFGAASTVIRITKVCLYLWTAGFFLGDTFLCTPISLNWDKTIPGGRCADITLYLFYNGLVNMILDIVIVIIPIPALSKLRIPLGQKLAISCLFSVGIL